MHMLELQGARDIHSGLQAAVRAKHGAAHADKGAPRRIPGTSRAAQGKGGSGSNESGIDEGME